MTSIIKALQVTPPKIGCYFISGRPRLNSDICSTLGIKIPIISAPLGEATGPAMTAAVSEAGGFGTIPLWRGGAEIVQEGIEQVRALTKRNFAVNLNMSFLHEKELQACIEQEIFAVSLFGALNLPS